MTLRIKEDVVVDTEYFLRPMDTCPRGRTVMLKVHRGGTVKGIYAGEDYYTGWAPMPKAPPWLKELERELDKKMSRG